MNYVPQSMTPDQILVLIYEELCEDIRAGKRVWCDTYREGDQSFGIPGYTFCSFPPNLGALVWTGFLRSTRSYGTYTLSRLAAQRAARLSADPKFVRFEEPIEGWLAATLEDQEVIEDYKTHLRAWRSRPWWRKFQSAPSQPFSPLDHSECRAYGDRIAAEEASLPETLDCLTCFDTLISWFADKPFPCEHCCADEHRKAVDEHWKSE